MVPKLLAFDLDDTLAESKQPLTDEMAHAFSSVLDHIPLAVMTGGAFPQLKKQFLSNLPGQSKLDHLYLFPTSAAQCYTYKDGDWRLQYDHSLTADEKAAILAAFDESLKEVGLAELPHEVWGDRIEDRVGQITFSGLGQFAPVPAKRAWDPDKKKRDALREALSKRLPKDFSIKTGGSTSVDITREGISKAYGITQLSELTGIPVRDMLYVGDALQDGGNDAVVKETGVPTFAVKNPDDTVVLLKKTWAEFHIDDHVSKKFLPLVVTALAVAILGAGTIGIIISAEPSPETIVKETSQQHAAPAPILKKGYR